MLSNLSQVRFVFIGPSKTASTWLYEVLRSHPQVSLPEAKDIDFFDRNYDRGTSWYLKQFASCDPTKVVGEFSHDYILHDSPALPRLKESLPRARLICCLRDPYERALSGVQFLRRNGVETGTAAEIARRHPEIVRGGLYFKNLSRVLALFPAEQVLVLSFDDLKADPVAFAQRVFKFLGVDEGFRSEVMTRVVNPKSAPRSRLLARLVKRTALWLRARGLAAWVGRIKRNPLVTRTLYRAETACYALSSQDVEYFSQAFEPDLAGLERLLGWNVQGWRRPG